MSGSRATGDAILRVDGISLSFGGVKALTDISFDVREHEVRAIIGPNGAGKSSMLNVINGVYHPQQGKIRYEEKEFSDMDPHAAASLGTYRPHQSRASAWLQGSVPQCRSASASCSAESGRWPGSLARQDMIRRSSPVGSVRPSRTEGGSGCACACMRIIWIGVWATNTSEPVRR